MKELVEKRNRMAKLHKTLKGVFDAAGKDIDLGLVKQIGTEDVSKLGAVEKAEKIRKINDELEELGADVEKLAAVERAEKRAKGMDPATPPKPADAKTPDRQEAKSVGDLIVESAWYKHIKEHGVRSASQAPTAEIPIGIKELKTLFQTTAGVAPESTRIGRIIEEAVRPVQILDLFPTQATGQASVVYLEETTRTHAAAETAEAGTYPEATFALTEQTSPVRKIATSLPVTDEQLEDVPMVRGYITNRLTFGLKQRLDSQLLNGDGTAPNLTGILNTSGIQTQALGSDNDFDAILKAITKVSATGRAVPNAVIVDSVTWQYMRLITTSDGIYILGAPGAADTKRIWGLPVVISDALPVTSGTPDTRNALVGDFANFSGLFERSGMTIKTGYVGTDFTTGRQTVRASLRVAFVVFRPAAFCEVTGLLD